MRDVMDFDYMKALRNVANEVKPDFWLMGEVIHGDYSRWANEGTLHSVTNYMLHKALYSGHNDHNYFEIAHTIKYVNDMVGNNLKLYMFVDNHDVERIYTKLNNKAHFEPVHVMLYTLPGIPSIYYGSEFAIEGRKEKFSDDSLRPELHYEDYKDAIDTNPNTKLIATLGRLHQNIKALCYGDYKQLELRNKSFAYARILDGKSVIITVSNGDEEDTMNVETAVNTCDGANYVGVLSGRKASVIGGRIQLSLKPNSGEIWVPEELLDESIAPIKTEEIVSDAVINEEAVNNVIEEVKPDEIPDEIIEDTTKQNNECSAKEATEEPVFDWSKPYEEMSVEQLRTNT